MIKINKQQLSYFKNINMFLLIVTIVLVLLFITIIVLYVNEKNTNVQFFLYNIYEKINKNPNQKTIINPNYKVTKENNIIIVNDFLTKDYFDFIRKQFDDKQFESRDFLVRKATGVNFFNLHKENYNGLVELYYSNNLLNTVSDIVKKPVQRISLADPNACSLLVYANKGDHINWHLDYSSYYGDRFVVLLTIVNENSEKNDLSENIFKYKYKNKINDVKMKENSLIIFKGSEIMHKSTAIGDNERRILLSMVFCDICQEKKNVFNIIYEKTKNYILYGE
jgi:hypothetical protein